MEIGKVDGDDDDVQEKNVMKMVEQKQDPNGGCLRLPSLSLLVVHD